MKYQQRTTVTVSMIIALLFAFAPTAPAQLPNPGMEIDPANTALVITDPQNDFLSPEGVTWGMVGKNVEGNRHGREPRNLVQAGQGQRHPGLHLAPLLLSH